MSSPPSIIDSFEEPLATFNRSTEVVYKKVQASSKTTEHKANGMLKLLKNYTGLGDRRIAPPLPEYKLDNEAELSNLTESQILQPIYEILHLRWPNKFSIRRESSPEMGDGTKDTTIRFDIVLNVNGNENKPLIVLELKRREQIKYEDFAPLTASIPEPGLMKYGSCDKDIHERIRQIKRMKKKTGFTGNATPYLKQISKYANSGEGCPYVALFNWDHLLLFKFEEKCLGDQRKGDQTTAGDVAELTWVSEGNALLNRDTGGYIQEGEIRKTLLGFMLAAFENKLGAGETLQNP